MTLLRVATIVPFVASCCIAAADDKSEKGRKVDRFLQKAGATLPPLLGAGPLIKALDSDGDGKLSATEIANASKALLSLDANGDGALSQEEFAPKLDGTREMIADRIGDGAGPEMLGKMFDRFDRNRNGKLEGDEIPEKVKANLSRVDHDGDGSLSKAEMEKVSDRFGDRLKADRRGKDTGPVKPKRPEAN
jgi:hypothetical protein